MSLRVYWIICALLPAVLCGCGGKVEYDDVEIGYRGPARSKPFLAAQRFLEAMEFEVHTTRDLRDCINESATLITPLQSFNYRSEADEVAMWARGGGHLILLLAGGESWRDDWDEMDLATIWRMLNQREEPGQKRLLEVLGIGNISSSSSDAKTELEIGKRTFECELAGRMKIENVPDWGTIRAGDKDEPSLVSYPLGSGRVTVLAHARPLRNRYIGGHDHAALLVALLSKGIADEIWFLDGVRISFWRMLWERAWLGICILAALLIVWLARYFRRFGPIAGFKTDAAREFSDHLLLTGAFLWRHKHGDALLGPVQNAITAAAARCGWHELNDEFFKFIHERTGMNTERARAIITSRAPADGHSLRLLAQDLKKMLDALA